MGRESRAQQPPGNRGIAWHQIKTLASLQEHKIVVIFRETLTEWLNDKAPRLGAALAFYTLFSLAPLLVVILAVAALVYGKHPTDGSQ